MRIKSANCTVAEKNRALKQVAMVIKDVRVEDLEAIKTVYDQVAAI